MSQQPERATVHRLQRPARPKTGTSPEELRALPPVVDVATAADVLGISRSAAYSMVKGGCWPTKTVKLGSRTKVITSELLRFLGIEP